jgi:hypothetical protein
MIFPCRLSEPLGNTVSNDRETFLEGRAPPATLNVQFIRIMSMWLVTHCLTGISSTQGNCLILYPLATNSLSARAYCTDIASEGQHAPSFGVNPIPRRVIVIPSMNISFRYCTPAMPTSLDLVGSYLSPTDLNTTRYCLWLRSRESPIW